MSSLRSTGVFVLDGLERTEISLVVENIWG